MPEAEPKWLTIAKGQIGTKEIPGPRSNPGVQKYYLGAVGKSMADSVPWCAAFLGWTLVQSSKKSSGSLLALSYRKYGTACQAKTGAIAVFSRGGGHGHVTFVESVSGNRLTCIGGNQSDAVTRATYRKDKAIAFRWPA